MAGVAAVGLARGLEAAHDGAAGRASRRLSWVRVAFRHAAIVHAEVGCSFVLPWIAVDGSEGKDASLLRQSPEEAVPAISFS
jgi:hypothetical protein